MMKKGSPEDISIFLGNAEWRDLVLSGEQEEFDFSFSCEGIQYFEFSCPFLEKTMLEIE